MPKQLKSFFVTLVASSLLLLIVPTVYASSEQVRGELNNWGATAWNMSSTLGGTFIYTSGQINDASNPSSAFKFFKDSNQWYGNGASANFGDIRTGINAAGGNMSFNHTSGNYYAFKWDGNSRGIVFQLSGAPVNVPSVSQSPAVYAVPPSTSVSVTATLSGTPPAEQSVWLRYTTDNFASSTVVQMTGSGTQYTAAIPASANVNGNTVVYYVFTSANTASIASSDADLYTISYNDNSGSRFRYGVGLNFVGVLDPDTNSPQTRTEGSGLTIYVQVFKSGVTEASGRGQNIECTLHWGKVSSFGGTWTNVTDTPMAYANDVGNNDRYVATITPSPGLYEYTANCTDITPIGENQTNGYTVWVGAGANGKLTVNTAGAICNGASTSDNNIFWAGLLHDSFATEYRNPLGAVATNSGTVTLKFRTCENDVSSVEIRLYDDVANTGNFYNMTVDSSSSGFTYWKYDLTVPASATIYYYYFRIINGGATAYYRDDNPTFTGGGYGQAEATQAVADSNSYQLTVYDSNFTTPDWMKQGIVYQIFPDRFRDGDASNNPSSPRFFYNEAGQTLFRSGASAWNTKICDPRGVPNVDCPGYYSNNFYGGDLKGIKDKIDQGFFDNLGVTVLYLNPIFKSPSNHKYDTDDYKTIDPDFGSLSDWNNLVTSADAHDIKIILDGVFNHTSSDSKYFDRYARFGDNGACEDVNSPYRSWYYLPDNGTPGLDTPGNQNTKVLCAMNTPYEAWYGYSSLPKLQANITAVRELIWSDSGNTCNVNSPTPANCPVAKYWTALGADGWRFDVGADVDPGRTHNSSNDYWEGFRTTVRAINSQALTLGEEWGDGSAWLLGNEWDSLMNYRFRSALLNWFFTGCSGTGCTGGTVFQENDSNYGSSSGAIQYVSPSQFNARLRSIQEDYPPMAWKAMMNLPGSHDTQRVRFLLYKINNDSDSAAVQRMKEWWMFAFTYAGAPTLYYGDEVGLTQDGIAASGTYQDDPYNRAPYPWDDTPGYFAADTTDLLAFQRKMASLRLAYPALQDGDVQHGILIDDANKMYGFARTNGSQTALIVLNRDSSAHDATLTGLNAAPYNLPDGTILKKVINGGTVTVSGGSVTVNVTATWGEVLLEQNKITTPVAPQNFTVTQNGAQNVLQWNPSVTDTGGQRELANAYTIHRSQTSGFTPGAGNLITTISPAAFGTSNGKVTWTDTSPPSPAEGTNATNYYAVCSSNAGGNTNCSTPLAPTGDGRCIVLEKPSALAPADGSSVSKRRVTLHWSPSFCVPKYKVIVRADAQTGPRVDGRKKLLTPTFITKKLERGKTYYWQVKACAAGQCKRSAWSTFTIP